MSARPLTSAPTNAGVTSDSRSFIRYTSNQGESIKTDDAEEDLEDDFDDEEEVSAPLTGWRRALEVALVVPKAIIRFFRHHPFTFVEVMTWLLFYLLGIVYYTNVEGMNTLDCLYFITVTVSTVGYGEFGATTDDSRVFTAFYSTFGIFCVLAAIDRTTKRWLVKVQDPLLNCLLGKKIHSPQTKIVFSLLIILLVLVTGWIGYACLEGWTAAEAFYWTVTTMNTVGYGNLSIKYDRTRIFGICFIYLVMFVYSLALANIFTAFQDIKDRSKRLAAIVDIHRKGIFQSTIPSDDLPAFLSEPDCAEFVVACLGRMGKISLKKDCEPIIKYFMQQRDLARKAERGYLMEHDAPVASGDALLQEERQADVRMKVDDFMTIAEQRQLHTEVTTGGTAAGSSAAADLSSVDNPLQLPQQRPATTTATARGGSAPTSRPSSRPGSGSGKGTASGEVLEAL